MDSQASRGPEMYVRSFGAEDVYYSRSRGTTKPHVPSVLQGIVPSTAGEEANRARRNWNQPIREALRTETGLRFAAGQAASDDAVSGVTIEVIDGVSEPLAQITREHPDPIAWWILLNRRKLENTAQGLDSLHQRIPGIIHSSLARQLSDGDADAVARSRDLIRRLLADEIDKPILERIRAIDRDWLGAYFFRQRRIELYASAIALWSDRLAVPIEDLAIVVLAHELAHAFTHIARDIDGRVWATNDFAQADLFLVEGLAQFYTDRVCDRLRGRRPFTRTAFDLLNENQSPPYSEFHKWKKVGPLVGEAVRHALIDCRVSPIKDHSIFYSVLQTAHSRLAKKQSPAVDGSTNNQASLGI